MPPFVVFALAGLSLSTPTAAADPRGTAAAPVERSAQKAGPRRYCFVDQVTGSRIPYRTCKTYSQWMKEGIDPTARP